MNKPDSPTQEPQIRFLVACPRSDSMLLMRIFTESPVCEVTSGLILTSKVGEEDGFSPNCSILENCSHHEVYIDAIEPVKQFLESKEELRKDSNKENCLYDTCPTPSTFTMVRPVFLIRDPIRVFDSWKNVGENYERSLLHFYNNLFRIIHQAPAHAVSYLLYEHFIQEPQREIKRICARSGVPFWEALLDFKEPFRLSFVFSSDSEKSIQLERHHFASLRLWRLPHPLDQMSYTMDSCRILRRIPLRSSWDAYIFNARGAISCGSGRSLQRKPGLASISTTLCTNSVVALEPLQTKFYR